MARIDRLAEEAKQVLQTAAVLGREFSPRLRPSWGGSSHRGYQGNSGLCALSHNER